MAVFEWTETFEDIYDSLPQQKRNIPAHGPKTCLIHSHQLKNIYEQLMALMKGIILPWDEDVKKRMIEDVCMCSPTKRKKHAHGTNLPSEESERMFWAMYEETMNLLNSCVCPIPEVAIGPLRNFLEKYLQTNISHYYIFLDLIHSYLKLPYRDCFQIRCDLKQAGTNVFGPGDFKLRMQEKRYNAVIYHCHTDEILTVFVAAATFKDYKAIQSYIQDQVDNYRNMTEDVLEEGKVVCSDQVHHTPKRKSRTTCKNKLKDRLVNHQVPQSRKQVTSDLGFALLKPKDKRTTDTLAMTNLKRCGKLKKEKHIINHILLKEVKSHRNSSSQLVSLVKEDYNSKLSQIEWEFLQILLERKEGDPLTYEEYKERNLCVMNKELLASFFFRRCPEAEMHVSVSMSTKNDRVNMVNDSGSYGSSLSDESDNMPQEEISLNKISDFRTDKTAPDYILESRCSRFWFTLFVYFALFGLCFTYLHSKYPLS